MKKLNPIEKIINDDIEMTINEMYDEIVMSCGIPIRYFERLNKIEERKRKIEKIYNKINEHLVN
jgi:hypothetical protein